MTGCGKGINSLFLLGSWRQWRWTSLGKSFSFLRSSSTSSTVTVIRTKSSSGTSYFGDDTGVPGIRGNEENLTVPWSSLMVENGNRFLKILKTAWRNVLGLVGG
ncbi:hypothetical protein Bca4012_090878 [Brassica carinata]